MLQKQNLHTILLNVEFPLDFSSVMLLIHYFKNLILLIKFINIGKAVFGFGNIS